MLLPNLDGRDSHDGHSQASAMPSTARQSPFMGFVTYERRLRGIRGESDDERDLQALFEESGDPSTSPPCVELVWAFISR